MNIKKYTFGQQHMKNLWHIVSTEGLKVDSIKIPTMKEWPIPKDLKELRGFWGLIDYY